MLNFLRLSNKSEIFLSSLTPNLVSFIPNFLYAISLLCALVIGFVDGPACALVVGSVDGPACALVGGSVDGPACALVGGSTDGHACALVGGSADGPACALVDGSVDGPACAPVGAYRSSRIKFVQYIIKVFLSFCGSH